jgi:16S rRNA (uracil1498-N3)-methyltransferase
VSIRLHVATADLRPGTLVLSGDEFHYAARVRRASAGQEIELFDGEGTSASARIVAIGPASLELAVQAPRRQPPPSPALWIAPALIKGERMEWAISKLIEVGAARILPTSTQHTVVRLDRARRESRKKRWDKLAKAAARQCRRAHLPEIDEVHELPARLSEPAELKLIATSIGPARPMVSLLPAEPPSSTLILVGPEGGFSAAEVEEARRSGFAPVSLGASILRSETACVAAAANLMFYYGAAVPNIASDTDPAV